MNSNSPGNDTDLLSDLAADATAQKLVADLLAQDGRVIALTTPSSEAVVREFGRVARVSGQSIYRWIDDVGLRSMREGSFTVPGSKRLPDALRYIAQSMQFGVYLFVDIDRHLRHLNVALLRQIARARGGQERKVVMLGEQLLLPAVLGDAVVQIAHRAESRTRPRLRDGRWVY